VRKKVALFYITDGINKNINYMRRIFKKKVSLFVNQTGRLIIIRSVKLKNQKFYKFLP
jgi:hypothetical protein